MRIKILLLKIIAMMVDRPHRIEFWEREIMINLLQNNSRQKRMMNLSNNLKKQKFLLEKNQNKLSQKFQ